MTTFPLWALATAMPVLAAASGPQEKEAPRIDPSDPTNIYTFVDINVEWQRVRDGNLYGLRLVPTVGIGPKHQVQAEIPLLAVKRDGADARFGLGDLRLRYFGLPHKDDKRVLSALGISLDLFAPTGSEADGLGFGAWIFSPGIVIGVSPTNVVKFFPVVGYQLSVHAGDAMGPPGTAPPGTTHGFRVEAITLFTITERVWAVLTPFYIADLTAGVHSLSLRFNFVAMVHRKGALGVDYLHELLEAPYLRSFLRVFYTQFF
jgi:hypothetical protein